MNWRRLIVGLSLLCMVIGALLVCFIEGGLLNPGRYGAVMLVDTLHHVGIAALIVGAIGLIVVWSMNKPKSTI